MNVEKLNEKFRKIGSKLVVDSREPAPRGLRWPPDSTRFNINVRTDKKKLEYFRLENWGPIKATVVDLQPEMRHLLLKVTGGETARTFLCGHDERHYFSATVPEGMGVTNVLGAMRALQPDGVRQQADRLPNHERFARNNAVYKRQGEWFFVPVSSQRVMPGFHDRLVIEHEPLRRGRSKPHTAQYLYRVGGHNVWVHPRLAPTGLTEEGFSRWKADHPKEYVISLGSWRRMQRGMRAFVKGWIRHPDHATLVLHGWHEVLVNNEPQTRENVFLD